MPRIDLTELTAAEAADNIARGLVSAEEYTAACLDRIATVDGEVRAFVHLDADHALAQARALDRLKAEGGRIGPLHGVPVGIKDIYDTITRPRMARRKWPAAGRGRTPRWCANCAKRAP